MSSLKKNNTYRLEKIEDREDWIHYESTPADALFLKEIRQLLGRETINDDNLSSLDEAYQKTSFPQSYNRFAIAVYQPGNRRILVLRARRSRWRNISAIVARVRNHKRFQEFDFSDEQRCRIQVDFILDPPKIYDIDRIFNTSSNPDRYEVGVDGLRVVDKDRAAYFLPGDAFVFSVNGPNKTLRHLRRKLGGSDPKDWRVERFRSQSYVSCGAQWLRLYRGYPLVPVLRKQQLEEVIDQAIDHVLQYQREDGRFLYYYCAARDSHRDHEHPGRDPSINPYYNILRHGGGVILLLLAYQRSKDQAILEHVRNAIEYLIQQIIEYELEDGLNAGYVFYNRKGKLGGQGINLYMLAEYQRLTGDRQYERWSMLLKNHIIAQITGSGEFFYYNVYLDKPVTLEENAAHFNFYYPGEAVIGLASYCKYVESDSAEKDLILEKLKRALRFLYVDREQIHADKYTSLPSDSWLMMAVNELWDLPEMQNGMYAEKVFQDADTMVQLMYRVDDGLYLDYPGSFYYKYGDVQYADGARCEGLVGAYLLARKTGDREREKRYGDALVLAVWATYHLTNTRESLYSAKRPEKALGGVRFKFNRQWFRIDTIQHVVAFYLKFLPYWDEHAPR